MSHRSRRRQMETPQQIARTRRLHLTLLGVIVLLVYISALPGDFVWTDQGDLWRGQQRLTDVDDIADAFSMTRDRYRLRDDGGAPELTAGRWQPGTIVANSVSWLLWGRCAACWHVESLLWHLLSVFSLYLLGRQLFRQHRGANRMAFWAAALFAAHPTGVTAVAWIGARPDLIGSALALLSLVLFSRLQPTTNVPRNHHYRWLAGSAAIALPAMLIHESAYLLPLLALLVAGVGATQRGRRFFAGISPARWQGIVALCGVLGLVLMARQLLLGGLQFAGDYPGSGVLDPTGTGLRHLWGLLDRVLIPGEPVVSDVWEISQGWDAGEVAALLGTLLLVGATFAGLAYSQLVAFGAAWFLLCVAPGVGLFPSERYHSDLSLYLATWGLMFSIVFIATQAWRPIGRQLVRGSEAILFTPFLIVLMVISGLSNARWWDHERLFESEIASDPHYIEGRLQLARTALREERPVDALNHLHNALESHQSRKFTGYWDQADIYALLGITQLRMALFDDALNSLQTAVEARPSSIRHRHLLAQAQIENAQFEAAERNLRQILQTRPDDAALRADLGVALLSRPQQREEGLSLLRSALQRPEAGNHRRHLALGRTLLEMGDFATASHHLQQALQSRETSGARAALALACWQQGDKDGAYRHLSTAMQTEDGDREYVRKVDRIINAETTGTTFSVFDYTAGGE